ncbi:T9SS type A sorting domain-containing protein [Aureisphaera galaxeae]|uniref:T9SS type A sorting domain-containing protein n=1 Tax=Aureisphaera galaxeae TaxID=1538023 RepID=UPI0023504F86|nr:T9SS type A sorting domain-containing protein [Aureisphaera galaxeae]MDC8005846.1 T9SS type A sorting domain-containing protein [Aureisphaera galaxeae]
MKQIFTLFILITSFVLHGQTYTNAESAEYDPVNDQWLVSNGSNIIADDGNGNLSFFGSASANTGMEVLNGILFAVDGMDIAGYDLATANEVMRLTITGAPFLNGLTNDGNSTLYVTDFTTRTIYAVDVSDISNPFYVEFVSDTINAPNGIIYDAANNRLIYVCWGTNAAIRAVDIATQDVSLIINSGITNLDGIDDDAEGNYYISSWTPDQIIKYNSDFSASEVIPTPSLNSPADIGYNQATDIIAIPMFTDVIFYDNSTLGLGEKKSEGFSIVPNPIDASHRFSIALGASQLEKLEVFDITGKKVSAIRYEEDATGIVSFSLRDHSLKSGVYMVKLTTEEGIFFEKLAVR